MVFWLAWIWIHFIDSLNFQKPKKNTDPTGWRDHPGTQSKLNIDIISSWDYYCKVHNICNEQRIVYWSFAVLYTEGRQNRIWRRRCWWKIRTTIYVGFRLNILLEFFLTTILKIPRNLSFLSILFFWNSRHFLALL